MLQRPADDLPGVPVSRPPSVASGDPLVRLPALFLSQVERVLLHPFDGVRFAFMVRRGRREIRRAFESLSKKNSEITATVGGVMADVPERQSNEDIAVTGEGASFPPSATLCHKCSAKALVIMDGCATCLNCGYSKCG